MDRVVTITLNPALDVSTTTEHVTPEHKLRCQAPDYDPGGGGINVARAITRLGGPAVALYTCGGPYGEMLKRLLDREGVRHQPVPIEGLTRESLTVIEASTNRQYRFGFPGPTLREEEWQPFLDYLATVDDPPDYVVASGSLPPGAPVDFYARLARVVRERGGRLVVDTHGQPLCEAAEAGVYLLKPNLRELGQIVGREIKSDAEIVAAGRDLIDDGDNEVVAVSLGAGGAMLITHDDVQRVRSPTVPIRSRIGAGDSMVGGMVYALAQGMSLLDAVRLGVAAGAAAVMTEGTDLMHRDDAERLFARMKEEAE